MPGPTDPAEMTAKQDRILGQLATINNRMDSHNMCIAWTKKFQSGDNEGGLTENSGHPWRPRWWR